MGTKDSIEKRAIAVGEHMKENNATVRDTAKHFGVGKTTIHLDVTKRLKEIDLDLYDEVKKVLDKNKEERYKRGGNARWGNDENGYNDEHKQ